MKYKDEGAWKAFVKNNSAGYGSAVMQYAERWADAMEEAISGGANLENIAKDTSHRADTEGITGFMYGCAVSILSQVWEHGESLRKWHNINQQIGDEGEKANKSGGCLNPALMNIEIPD